MDRKTKIYILASQVLLLIIILLALHIVRPTAQRLPVLLGWVAASLNFTVAMVSNLGALRKSFEAFKLSLMVWTGARLGALLALLVFVMKFKKDWTRPFSSSLLFCFGIYIILEVVFFYTKARRMMK